jgi:hypothetical protein
MTFEVNKIGKLEDRLEEVAYEWVMSDVNEYFGVNEVSELTNEQIQEIVEYEQSGSFDEYWIGVVLRSIVDQWQEETGQQL